MKKLLSLLIVLFLCSVSVNAANVLWTGDGADPCYTTGVNWQGGNMPSTNDAPFFNSNGTRTYPCEIHTSVQCQYSNMGHAPGELTAVIDILDGGEWLGGDMWIGRNGNDSNPAKGIVNVNGGKINMTKNIILGANESVGILNIYDGESTANIMTFMKGFNNRGDENQGFLNMYGGKLELNQIFTQEGELNLNEGGINLEGGVLQVNTNIILDEVNRPNVKIDISKDGVLLVKNSLRPTVDAEIAEGMITAWGGLFDTVIVEEYDPAVPDYFGVLAPFYLEPVPANGSEVFADEVTEISWTLPEPNLPSDDILVDLYFGEGTDPNAVPQELTGESNVSSFAVTLTENTDYIWKIKVYDENSSGAPILVSEGIFQFQTKVDNKAPTVDAGADDYTWLDNGSVSYDFNNASVIDDGGGELSYTWTTISQPGENAPIIDPCDVLNATVTLVDSGMYTFELTVVDSFEGNPQFTESDTINIMVYDNGCAAAKQEGLYTEAEARAKGDTNYNCVVNLADLKAMASNWLIDVSDEL